MALQVWLPLNDSVQNKGLNNATVTVNGTTAYANGKRGRCLSCNGSSYWLISPLTIGTTASISFWAQTTDTNAMFYVLGATSYAHLNFWRANSKYYLNKGDSYQNPFQNNGADVAWHNDGNWHHYVTVFDGSMCSLYVDGAYYGAAKTYAAPTCNGTNVRLAGGFSNGHSYDTNGLISDFRVYDNVLTNEDIKELYWGKILEFTPQWIDKDRIMDASGFNFPLTPHNLTISGNEAKFNGSSTYVEFNGLHLSGGSVSIWANLPAKPNAQKIYYCDPTSKMVVGYLAGGTILTAANGANKASYQSTGITWKQWHHIVAVWNSSYVPTALYVNGVQAATGTSSNWTNSGAIAGIGRRIGSGNADYLSGSVNEVKVFSSQLTAADVQKLYAMGPNKNDWTEEKPDIWRNMYLDYSGCTWLKVLHHNAPATNLFTTANRKNNDDENLFSRLGLFDDTAMFKMTNGKYQFMVREKLESTSTENIGIWTQTSSPTASAIAGYAQIYSSTGSWPRSFGLTHQSANAVFDESGSGWWCACGCSTAYQGGIPGFWGNVKTGYIDLYIRVDDTQFFNNMG